MELPSAADLQTLGIAGRNAVAHATNISRAHAALLKLEAKHQLKMAIVAFLAGMLALACSCVALIFGSLAIAEIINDRWPALGRGGSFALVASGNLLIGIALAVFARILTVRIPRTFFASLTSWKESLECLLRKP